MLCQKSFHQYPPCILLLPHSFPPSVPRHNESWVLALLIQPSLPYPLSSIFCSLLFSPPVPLGLITVMETCRNKTQRSHHHLWNAKSMPAEELYQVAKHIGTEVLCGNVAMVLWVAVVVTLVNLLSDKYKLKRELLLGSVYVIWQQWNHSSHIVSADYESRRMSI